MNAIYQTTARARLFEPERESSCARIAEICALALPLLFTAGWLLVGEYPDVVDEIRLFCVRFPEASHEFLLPLMQEQDD